MFNEKIEKFYDVFTNKNNQEFVQDLTEFQQKFLECHPRYIDAVYPPAIFTAEFIEYLKESTEFLLKMVFSIPERIFHNDYRRMINYQGYSEDDAHFLLSLCKPELLAQAKLLARPDFLLTTQGLKVVEMNIASAIGGIAVTDRYIDNFYKTRLFDALMKEGFKISYHPVARNWADFLYSYSKNINNQSSSVVLMALISKDELNKNHYNSFVTAEVLHFLRMNGFRTLVAPLEEIQFNDNDVYYNGTKIDIVLTSFIFIESRDSGLLHICNKLIESHLKGSISYFGGEITTIFDNKINLSILSSGEFSQKFSNEERRKIEDLVPYTYKLTEANIKEAFLNQKKLVLKKCISFGGSDVVIGLNKTKEEWEAILINALSQKDSYILQELIEPRIKRKSHGINGLDFYDMCVGSFYFGKFSGTFIREKYYLDGQPNIINCSNGAKFSSGLYTIC